MSSRRTHGLLVAACLAAAAGAAAQEADTLTLREVTVSDIRGNRPLRRQALSSATLSALDLRSSRVASLKDLGAGVAGLYAPSYGSRQTTPVYMRGVGSRINTPSVALYVNDVPQVNKSAYALSLADAERIEVLRGPQNTLYGRNAMGGLIKVTTRSPLEREGTDVEQSAGTGCDRRVSVRRAQRLGPGLGLSFGSSFSHSNGFFTNEATGQRMDWDNDFLTSLRLAARPSERVSLDLQASFEYAKQGAFPYRLERAAEGDFFLAELAPDQGRAAQDHPGQYKSSLLNTSLRAEHRWRRFTLTNVLGYQHLKDDMRMDQDFTRLDIYTLRQRQRSGTLSEEIAVKNRPGAWRHWEWSTGVSGFAQWLTTRAPVTFGRDGLAWLNATMARGAAAGLPGVESGPARMDFRMDDRILGEELPLGGKFRTPSYNAALYHQSTARDALGVRGLDVTAGLRLDYERACLTYSSDYAFSHAYSLAGRLTTPAGARDITLVPEAVYEAGRALEGSLSKDCVKLLPRFSAQYGRGGWHVYATVSRGYRSGGYNIQMFSEVLQELMRSDIMGDAARATLPALQAQAAVPPAAKEQVTAILERMARGGEADVRGRCSYRPELAWNYEAGAHADLMGGRLRADVSLYLMRVSGQQVSRMARSGLGRVTANAGRSRSMGLEAALSALLGDRLTARASYGFTHATFRDWTEGGVSYRGRRVPFAPRHTLCVGGRYSAPCRKAVDRVTAEASWRAAGGIRWTEDNTQREPFYGTLEARVSATRGNMEVGVWGSNLTDKSYRVFYFESMGRAFSQKGRPLQAGFDVRLSL